VSIESRGGLQRLNFANTELFHGVTPFLGFVGARLSFISCARWLVKNEKEAFQSILYCEMPARRCWESEIGIGAISGIAEENGRSGQAPA
jgi:hypothetical protein